MAFDIAAIQFLYGARAANTDDTTYTLVTANATGTGWKAIWDTAGTDTISAAASTSTVTINLNDAPLDGSVNAGGFVSWQSDIQGGYTIANGVSIENAIGGSGNDILIGNESDNSLTGSAGNDTLTGNAGADTIDGGAGLDISAYSIASSAATTTVSDGVITTNDGSGADILTNVERLSYSDGFLAFDTTGAAGQTYRLYQAAFDRTPDTPGLSHNVNLFDNGLTLKQLSDAFLASAEFIALYGADSSNTVLLTAFYANVLNRAPDTGGFNGWNDLLTSGTLDRADVLIGFSESLENIALVGSAIENGIWLGA